MKVINSLYFISKSLALNLDAENPSHVNLTKVLISTDRLIKTQAEVFFCSRSAVVDLNYLEQNNFVFTITGLTAKVENIETVLVAVQGKLNQLAAHLNLTDNEDNAVVIRGRGN